MNLATIVYGKKWTTSLIHGFSQLQFLIACSKNWSPGSKVMDNLSVRDLITSANTLIISLRLLQIYLAAVEQDEI